MDMKQGIQLINYRLCSGSVNNSEFLFLALVLLLARLV